jgi:hypothetical protein
VFERDPAQLGWKEIVETNSWGDAGEYLLHCHRIGGSARRTRDPIAV